MWVTTYRATRAEPRAKKPAQFDLWGSRLKGFVNVEAPQGMFHVAQGELFSCVPRDETTLWVVNQCRHYELDRFVLCSEVEELCEKQESRPWAWSSECHDLFPEEVKKSALAFHRLGLDKHDGVRKAGLPPYCPERRSFTCRGDCEARVHRGWNDAQRVVFEFILGCAADRCPRPPYSVFGGFVEAGASFEPLAQGARAIVGFGSETRAAPAHRPGGPEFYIGLHGETARILDFAYARTIVKSKEERDAKGCFEPRSYLTGEIEESMASGDYNLKNSTQDAPPIALDRAPVKELRLYHDHEAYKAGATKEEVEEKVRRKRVFEELGIGDMS